MHKDTYCLSTGREAAATLLTVMDPGKLVGEVGEGGPDRTGARSGRNRAAMGVEKRADWVRVGGWVPQQQ